jgi:molybdopterin-containing oxidoreductase family iron-sulfur binding subunit
LTERTALPGREIVRRHWRGQWQGAVSTGDFEDWWETTVHDGVVENSAFSRRSTSLQEGWEKHLQAGPAGSQTPSGSYELVFQPDPTLYDGRFANNGWLQELPKPITRLTWDNAALMSPATAKELGVALGSYAHGGEHGGFHQPVIELRLGESKVRLPAWIVPGHADRTITVYLGHGQTAAGKIGSGVGGNVYPLRTSEHPWFAPGLAVVKTPYRHLLACTQQHQMMENRALVRSATLASYK